MAQTPQQRLANQKFAKKNQERMGKSVEDIKSAVPKEKLKSPVPPLLLWLLVFVVAGGLVVEVIARIFGR
ncbi:hypothetical protein QBC35DRAFT_482262 [Podospora australis]|uniref:Stress-associated endoplasmic reticulum protein n=1 Tax=Podospora australis TaxID=1536484 RepID=A0AAN6X408_9PEZI|nr:hypothetical protein QBC35DRAFT_482262 [Podospora australis]